MPANDVTPELRDLLVAEHRTAEALEVAGRLGDPVSRALEHHIAGRFQQAADACRRALEARPDDVAALLYLGRAAFNLGDRRAAFDALRTAVRFEPDYAAAWYALAHALRASGDMPGACAAYERALEESPDLRQARLNLGITRFNMDDADGALDCFERLLERDGDDIEVLVHSGLALHLRGDVSRAERRLERALELAPENPDAHRLLAAICNETGDAERAVTHLNRALVTLPDDPDLLADLADVHELSSDLNRMREILDRGIAVAPGHSKLNLEAARLDRRSGHPDRCLTRLERLDPETLPPRLAQQYFHELGLCLDRLEQPDGAMRALESANRIGARSPRARVVDRGAIFTRIRAIEGWLDQEQRVPRTDGLSAGQDLCFLIGFPRSGTTLLDTILGAHPDVACVEEKATLEHVVTRIGTMPGGYPHALDELSGGELEEMRALYRRQLAPHLPRPGARLVIDKLPLRLIHAVLILRLFPSARLLFALRHPCDVVLSNFMQMYEPTEAFVHCDTLEGTVTLYDTVMRLWQRLAPLVADRLATVRYESLVTDPVAELESVCGFLGIAWHPDMLEAQSRLGARGRIRTTSYQQVSEDIYRRAAGRWTRYSEYLQPYLTTLESHVYALGYTL